MKVSEIRLGDTYNGLLVLDYPINQKENYRQRPKASYLCKCPKCGKDFYVQYNRIGKTKMCANCVKIPKSKDLIGKKINILTVIDIEVVNGRARCKCVCECGRVTSFDAYELAKGKFKSCGCSKIENAKRSHRRCVSPDFDYPILSEHPLWTIWYGIKMRCECPTDKSYPKYGGRGIKMCDRWSGNLGFENFVNDMGERPTLEHTLDRIAYNGDYEPCNCRWATPTEQANNKTDNVYITVGDKQITAKQFCKMLGLNYWVAIKQIQRGYDINLIAKDVRFNQGKYRRREDLRNHNRVVSDEVMKLLETKLNNK